MQGSIVDKIPVVDTKFLPEFFKGFFSSPYTASWLGIYMPNIYEIREYVLANTMSLDPEFINAAFLDFNEQTFMDGYDERIPPDRIKELVFHILTNFSRLSEFIEAQDEVFCIEMQFQLPFIHKSRFDSGKRRSFILDGKTRYESSFRKNYTGRFLVLRTDFDEAIFRKEHHILQEIGLSNNDIFNETALKCFLQYPVFLKLYWDEALKLIFERVGFSFTGKNQKK
jgi:hypothetical protein